MRLGMFLALFLAIAGPASAAEDCAIPDEIVASEVRLPNAMRRLAEDKRLDVMVVTSADPKRTSTAGRSYPYWLQESFAARHPEAVIRVTVHVEAEKTAAEAADNLKEALETTKPSLVVWQIGTVDAMNGESIDNFGEGIERGIATIRAAGADLVIVNMQFSPRLAFFVDPAPYLGHLRWLAQSSDVPLFDRYGLMSHWSDSGRFDFMTYKHDSHVFAEVHRCIGEALSMLLTNAVSLPLQPETH